MSYPHKWQILVTAGSYFMSLADNFPGGDIELGYDNDELGINFYAFSHHIDVLADPNEVAERVYALQLLLNGALTISRGNTKFQRIEFGGFSECEGGRWHSAYANKIEEYPFENISVWRENRPAWDDPKNNFSTHLLAAAKVDSDIRTLVFLVGLISKNSPLESILTWGTLYKILDCIRHYAKGIGMSAEDFSSKEGINRFTAACNNMSVLGLYARHGAAANPPPRNATTDLDEAISVIVSMASAFCHAYLAKNHAKLN